MRRVGVGLVLLGCLLMAGVILFYLAPKANGATGCREMLEPGEVWINDLQNHGPCTYLVPDKGVRNAGQTAFLQDGDVIEAKNLGGLRAPIRGEGAREVVETHGRVILRGVVVTGSHGDNDCAPGCGKGIQQQTGTLTLSDVRASGHKNQGAANKKGSHMIVLKSEIDNNGSAEFTRLDPTGGPGTWNGSAAGIKAFGRITVQDSYIHDNFWQGIWCDGDGGGPTNIRGTLFEDNAKTGLQQEKCIGEVIAGNTFRGNGRSMALEGYQCPTICGNIFLARSAHTLIRDNIIRRTDIIYDRSPEQTSFPQIGNEIRDNDLKMGAHVEGCSRVGIKCSGNR
jgi:hypothetical protein